MKRFVNVRTISLTPCDNNQWNLLFFICILTRIASIFRTKIKEKRQNRMNTCFLHHDFVLFCCKLSVNECKCIEEVYLLLNVFYQQSKTGDKRLTGKAIIQLQNEAAVPRHITCVSYLWHERDPVNRSKWHLVELQLHYNCNLSVLLHLFHFILLNTCIT